MITIPFSLTTKHAILSGIILQSDTNNNPPRFLYLHGGGNVTSKERVYDVAKPILQHNINIVSFDHSGHGKSSGNLAENSLEKRVLEAHAIIKKHTGSSLIICAASMGGYIAIKLLELCTVDTLILMCPALYDQRAYSVPFGKGFTDILRTPESWRNTDALKILEKFTGKLMVIVGDKDEVIPPVIITLIMHHSPMAQKKELYVIPNCPHKINTWLADHPEELLNMHNKIEQFIAK